MRLAATPCRWCETPGYGYRFPGAFSGDRDSSGLNEPQRPDLPRPLVRKILSLTLRLDAACGLARTRARKCASVLMIESRSAVYRCCATAPR